MICHFLRTGLARFALLLSICLAAIIAPLTFELFPVLGAGKAGDLDTTFGFYKDGTSVDDISNVWKNDGASAVALQPDGKIVAAGVSIFPLDGKEDFAIARYNSDGSLDMTFNQTGVLQVNLAPATGSNSTTNDYVSAVMIQSDGKIVVAGTVFISFPQEWFAVVRINTDGTLDTSFGNGGLAVTKVVTTGRNVLSDAFLQPDGKIVAVGWVWDRVLVNQAPDFALVRYNTDGSLDASFGTNGIVKRDLKYSSSNGTPFQSADRAYAASLESDGKIVVVGKTEYTFNGIGKDDFTVVRFDSNGGLDVQVKMSLGDIHAEDVLIQPDGKILVTGRHGVPGSAETSFALLRLNGDLSLDSAFGNGGVAITNPVVPSGNVNVAAKALALQPDGKIVVAGEGQDPVNLDYGFVLARYNNDGSLDTSFGKYEGFTSGTDFFGLDDRASDLVIQSDGKIVVAGSATSSVNGIQQTDFAIARYHGSDYIDDGPQQQISDLIALIDNLNLSKQPAKKLNHELNKALDAMNAGDMKKACREIDKFIKTVERESGRKLTTIEATLLLENANRLRLASGC